MRLNACVIGMAPFGLFAAFIEGCVTFDSGGRNGGQPTRRDGQPARKVFTVDRHGLAENFVSFRNPCGLQSSPLEFAPNRDFVCVPLQGHAPLS